MQKFGLIGYPLSHSLSPKLHSLAYKSGNIQAKYSKIELIPERFGEQINQLKKQDFNGFNVTIPYKTKFIPYLDFLDETVKLTGAVNTIKIINDKWHGYNTDVKGFLYPIQNNAKQFRKCLILGNGGAARAVLYALLNFAHPDKITIAARNEITLKILQQNFKQIKNDCDIEISKIEQVGDSLVEFDLIVNTTPLGMYPNINESPLPDKFDLKPKAIVYDLIYNPNETKFLKDAKNNCPECITINGKIMLIAQAMESIKIWTGVEIQVESILPNL